MFVISKILAVFLSVVTLVACGAEEKIVSQTQKQAVVSFTFDDVPRSVYWRALPLLTKANMRGTLYVSTDLVGKHEYLTWEDIKMFYQFDWEIGGHAHTHDDLTKMSEAEAEQEIAYSTARFNERGFYPISFAAPFGEYNSPSLMNLLKKNYSSNRAAWGNNGINPYPVTDPYNIVSLGITREVTMEEISRHIDTIKRDGGWLILQFHHIDDGQSEGMPFGKDSPYATKLLPEIVAKVQQEKVTVLTVGEAIAHSFKGVTQ